MASVLAAISPSFSNSPCPQHGRYEHARRSLTKQGGRTRAQRVLTRLRSSEGRGGWEPRKAGRAQWERAATGRKRESRKRIPTQTEHGHSRGREWVGRLKRDREFVLGTVRKKARKLN